MVISKRIQRRIEAAPAGAVLTIEEFGQFASPAATGTAFARLAKRGVLDRVRRGIYYKPRISRFGRGSARADDLAFAASKGRAPGYAGASAAAALGLSTQIPPNATLAIVGRRPTSIPNVRFIERSNMERVTARLRASEIALLEVLRDDLKWVELSDAEMRKRIRDLIDAGTLDARRLLRAAKHEPRRVREKLATLLPTS